MDGWNQQEHAYASRIAFDDGSPARLRTRCCDCDCDLPCVPCWNDQNQVEGRDQICNHGRCAYTAIKIGSPPLLRALPPLILSHSLDSDWGRSGASKGFLPPPLGNDYDGRCGPNYGKKTLEDVRRGSPGGYLLSSLLLLPKATGGPEQKATARALNEVCGREKCSFLVNTGDNFYECGLDNMTRFEVGSSSVTFPCDM